MAKATPKKNQPYKRILLKLGGEALQGPGEFGLHLQTVNSLAAEIAEVAQIPVQLGIVVGGGNIFRGSAAENELDRATGDYMGMLATIINAMALQDSLERAGVITRVMTAIEMCELAEPYIRRRAVRHLEKGRVVIFGGGTGNPYFTTDTAAALRAVEIGAEVVMKATKVDGIYDADPIEDKSAKKFEKIAYREVLARNLEVMDATATSLCMENDLPILVFNWTVKGNIRRAVLGEKIGTVVHAG